MARAYWCKDLKQRSSGNVPDEHRSEYVYPKPEEALRKRYSGRLETGAIPPLRFSTEHGRETRDICIHDPIEQLPVQGSLSTLFAPSLWSATGGTDKAGLAQ